ncbi:MAG: protease inhibitor I42 family protein [Chloroflexota bacterium]
MKRSLFLLCAVALTLAACGGTPTETPADAIAISDPGKTIEVTAGNEFKIVIESNPSTGYHWELVGDLDAGVLEFVSKDYRASEPVMPGSGGKDVWVFKAVAAGEATITLGHYPPAQGEPAAQEVTFTIVVK